MAANKADQNALEAFGTQNYAAMPKSVLAMLAYSLAQRIAGDSRERDEILAEISREWGVLHANGIVPQKPKLLETREQEAARIEGYFSTGRDDELGRSNRARIAVLRATT